MVTCRKLSDLEKARLFLRALNSFTMAEAALRHRDRLKPPFRSLVDRLLGNWQRTEAEARKARSPEAASILEDFMETLDGRMVRGQKDIEERFGHGEKTGPLLLAWGLFYLFKTRAQDLVDELALVRAPVTVERPSEQVAPAARSSPDLAALHEFQMALGLGP